MRTTPFSMLLALVLMLITHNTIFAVEIGSFTAEGNILNIDNKTITIQTHDGSETFYIGQETVFCKSGYKVTSWKDFSSENYANIVKAAYKNKTFARVVYNTETVMKLHENPGLSLSMSYAFPDCRCNTRDNLVKKIQQHLIKLGYKVGKADGILGKGTQSAIVNFQKRHKFLATGVPSESLYKYMLKAK